MKQPEKLKVRENQRKNAKKTKKKTKKPKKHKKHKEEYFKRKSSTLLNTPEVINKRRKKNQQL